MYNQCKQELCLLRSLFGTGVLSNFIEGRRYIRHLTPEIRMVFIEAGRALVSVYPYLELAWFGIKAQWERKTNPVLYTVSCLADKTVQEHGVSDRQVSSISFPLLENLVQLAEIMILICVLMDVWFFVFHLSWYFGRSVGRDDYVSNQI